MTNMNSTKWRIFKRKKDVLNTFTALTGAAVMVSAGSAMAAPTGGVITQGGGSIAQVGANTNIQQNTQLLDIRWNDFSSNVGESINFNQPNSSSTAINRVTGGVPSQLNGALNANGRVFVMNDAGVTFGKSATVNVGSLIATTAKDVSATANGFDFTGSGDASVVNNGNITVSNGGFAVLAAPQVANNGRVQANLGQVHLAAANNFTLDFRGDSLITYTANKDVVEEIKAENAGTIEAQSGLVTISTAAADKIVKSVINMGGLVDASSFTKDANGGTVLVTSTGDIVNTGTVDVSADENGNGGTFISKADGLNHFTKDATIKGTGGSKSGDGAFAEVSGKNFLYEGSVALTAINGKPGTLYIDPVNLTIADGSGPAVLDTVYEEDIEADLQSGINVALGADNFTIANLSDNELKGGTGNFSLTTLVDGGSIVFTDTFDIISTTNGSITLTAGTGGITGGILRAEVADGSQVGSITATATGDITFNGLHGTAQGGDINIDVTSSNGDISINELFLSNKDGSSPLQFADNYVNVSAEGDVSIETLIAYADDFDAPRLSGGASNTVDITSGSNLNIGQLDVVADAASNTSRASESITAKNTVNLEGADVNIDGHTIVRATADADKSYVSARNDVTITSTSGDVTTDFIIVTAEGSSTDLVVAESVDVDSNLTINSAAAVDLGQVIVDATAINYAAIIDALEVEFKEAGRASYTNTFGYYYTDADGNPTTGEIIFADVTTLTDGDLANLNLTNADNIGFFLIPNGQARNTYFGNPLTDGDAVTFQNVGGNWVPFLGGTALQGTYAPAFFTDSTLNPAAEGGLAKVEDNANPGNLNWEDKSETTPGGSDNDFDDANFQADVTLGDDVNSTADASFTLNVGGDLTLTNNVDVTATVDTAGNGGNGTATSLVDISSDATVTVDGDVTSTAEAPTEADARIYVEAGKGGDGDAIINGALSSDATAGLGEAYALVSVVAPEANALEINGTDPKATADGAFIQQDTTGEDVDGSDKGELVLRDGGTTPPEPENPEPETPEPETPEPETPEPEVNNPNLVDPNLLVQNDGQSTENAGGLDSIAPAAGDNIETQFCRMVNVEGARRLLCRQETAGL